MNRTQSAAIERACAFAHKVLQRECWHEFRMGRARFRVGFSVNN